MSFTSLPKVSIVIPVFNVKGYFGDCIESVLCQTYENIEVIIIDDGSTDGSSEVCEYYALRDKRIKLVHKQNGGLSDARNVGIDLATGDYISFIDSDDVVDLRYIELLYKGIEHGKTMISLCSFLYIDEYGMKQRVYKHIEKNVVSVLTQEDALRKMLAFDEYTHSAWGKMFSKSLFKDIRYPKGRICEDLATTYKLFLTTDRISYVHEELYFYRMNRRNSIQNSEFSDNRMDEFEFALEQKKVIDEKYPELKDYTISRVISSCFHVLFMIEDKDKWKDSYDTVWQYIKDNRIKVIISNNTTRKIKVGCVISLLGADRMKKIYEIASVRGKFLS